MRYPILVSVLLIAHSASAATFRYALVIGNDQAPSAEVELPALAHAESEAKLLREKLISCCNFDDASSRTVLLLRPTRAALREAVRGLSLQIAADREKFGGSDTLFAFFFTGHGLNGRLLFADGALPHDELAAIFREINAKFTIGVFDACYSASLDPGSLMGKGVVPTPGVNVLRELPSEILTAEGSIWFVSSGPNEASYEDKDLGGVFTHFLLEAFESAPADGPGISLEHIYAYARGKTVAYTAARNRAQTPQRITAKLTERNSIYFSFPRPRTSTLKLSDEIRGSFLLSYAEGQLVERIEKTSAGVKSIAVYPGRARLSVYREGALVGEQDLEIADSGELLISPTSAPGPRAAIGSNVGELLMKGKDGSLRATSIDFGGSLFIGAAYELEQHRQTLVASEHAGIISARFDRGMLSLAALVGYGASDQKFPAWSYSARGLFGELRGGVGMDFAETRASLLAGARAGSIHQRYGNGETRASTMIEPTLTIDLAHALSDRFLIGAQLRGGLISTDGAGNRAQRTWGPAFAASLGFATRIF